MTHLERRVVRLARVFVRLLQELQERLLCRRVRMAAQCTSSLLDNGVVAVREEPSYARDQLVWFLLFWQEPKVGHGTGGGRES